MNTENNNEYLFNLINILSFIIGVENLNLNDKQIEKLESHLSKQDKQYEEIIRLLKEGGILDGRREQK
jgi:hypothetical protein|uniref:Uncharacterized protein n=1 Tax=Siphoviridae sp. ctt8434 TaxID=2825703 RepID=A0A8S5U1G4_9CAUD|nr:MAG TPA: hypothetical protein [Siphoviridae sp. ctt8434]